MNGRGRGGISPGAGDPAYHHWEGVITRMRHYGRYGMGITPV